MPHAPAIRRPIRPFAALATAALTAVALGGPAPATASPPASDGASATPSAFANGRVAPAPQSVSPGGSLRLAASDLGPGSTVKSPDAARLPAPAKGAKLLGQHKVYYTPLTWTSTTPPQDPIKNAATYVARADAYWREASGNTLTVALGWAKDWAPISLSSSELASCDKEAIWREVSRYVSGGSEKDHILFNLPYNPNCDWVDLEFYGPTDEGYGMTWTNGVIVPKDDVIGRAIMTNDSVMATDALLCTAGGKPVPLSDDCTHRAFTDPWSPNSDQPYGYGHVGMPHAVEMAYNSMVDESEIAGLYPGDPPTTIDLGRLQLPSNGTRLAWFSIDGYRYSIEYRTASGLDSWIDDKTYTDAAGVTRTMPGGGVILVRTPSASKDPQNHELVHFNPPVPGQEDTARHPGLEAGESYTAPDGLFAIKVNSTDSDTANITVSFPGLTAVPRWDGIDRYDASAKISAENFKPGVDTAYLASGLIYTDALSGAPVAGKTEGPVLLTARDSLSREMLAELKRLRPAKIVVLGGPNTIYEEVLTQAQEASGAGSVVRWSGADRFETSAEISARSYDSGVDTVFVASGRVSSDALSGAPVAGRDKAPMLLVDTDALPASIASELERLAPKRIVVLGGPNTISPAVEGKLGDYADTIERWAGSDRFAASATIAANSYDPGVGTAYIASGRGFSDALSGAPVAGMTGGPVLLTDTKSLPDAAAAELRRLKPKRIVVLGGPNTISYGVQAALSRYVAP